MVKNPPANAGDVGLIPESGRSLEEEMATHLVFLPWKSHGQRNLVGYSLRGCKELDTNEHICTIIEVRNKCDVMEESEEELKSLLIKVKEERGKS